mmetsp:Transcript_19385/g.44630  ORF Transcript_19385/g.44630 Transcript_19385/m.44630 type:complete len:293 (-) Transcript_19385:148-1026(-)
MHSCLLRSVQRCAQTASATQHRVHRPKLLDPGQGILTEHHPPLLLESRYRPPVRSMDKSRLSFKPPIGNKRAPRRSCWQQRTGWGSAFVTPCACPGRACRSRHIILDHFMFEQRSLVDSHRSHAALRPVPLATGGGPDVHLMPPTRGFRSPTGNSTAKPVEERERGGSLPEHTNNMVPFPESNLPKVTFPALTSCDPNVPHSLRRSKSLVVQRNGAPVLPASSHFARVGHDPPVLGSHLVALYPSLQSDEALSRGINVHRQYDVLSVSRKTYTLFCRLSQCTSNDRRCTRPD